MGSRYISIEAARFLLSKSLPVPLFAKHNTQSGIGGPTPPWFVSALSLDTNIEPRNYTWQHFWPKMLTHPLRFSPLRRHTLFTSCICHYNSYSSHQRVLRTFVDFFIISTKERWGNNWKCLALPNPKTNPKESRRITEIRTMGDAAVGPPGAERIRLASRLCLQKNIYCVRFIRAKIISNPEQERNPSLS